MKRLVILFLFLAVLVGWFVFLTSNNSETQVSKVTSEQVMCVANDVDSIVVDSLSTIYKE